MTYELAKELKDAGFDHRHGAGCYEFETDTCIPRLEELIEACGERLSHLGQYVFPSENGDKWIATGFMYIEPKRVDVRKAEAPTPTEAVARLWIVLNKK